MSKASERLSHHREGKKQLAKITNNRNEVVVIHYSCESFYNRPNRTSPRITSIAVRNLATGQTESFSIHQTAERDKKFSIEEIEAHYDELEKKMLEEFYDYAKSRQNHTWLHWNMRDSQYGFTALEHRYRIHGGEPIKIPEVCRCDLSRMLIQLYGVRYISHPRLENLAKKNLIGDLNFLSGKKESEAFENGEYVKLHQSILRKVDTFSNILDRAADGTLKTNARLTEIYGGYVVFAIEKIKESWFFVLFGIAGTIASILSLLWCN